MSIRALNLNKPTPRLPRNPATATSIIVGCHDRPFIVVSFPFGVPVSSSGKQRVEIDDKDLDTYDSSLENGVNYSLGPKVDPAMRRRYLGTSIVAGHDNRSNRVL